MHKYHTPDNPNWTPKSQPPLLAEQWRNAYLDLKREYDALELKYREIELALERATEWHGDSDVGC